MTAFAGAFSLAIFFKLFVDRISSFALFWKAFSFSAQYCFEISTCWRNPSTHKGACLWLPQNTQLLCSQSSKTRLSSSSSSAELPRGSERKGYCRPVKFAGIFVFTRAGRVSFIVTFGYSAICNGRCSTYLQVKLENLKRFWRNVSHFSSGSLLEINPIFWNDGIFNRRSSCIPDTSTPTYPCEGHTLGLTGWLAAEDSWHCYTGSWHWSKEKLKLKLSSEVWDAQGNPASDTLMWAYSFWAHRN